MKLQKIYAEIYDYLKNSDGGSNRRWLDRVLGVQGLGPGPRSRGPGVQGLGPGVQGLGPGSRGPGPGVQGLIFYIHGQKIILKRFKTLLTRQN